MAAEPTGGPATPPGPELRRALEGVLLVVDEPVPADVVAEALDLPPAEVEAALTALAARYREEGRGFVLRSVAGGWRLYTDPSVAPAVERFVLHGRSGRLTQAALETLAIVAYQQPVTRARISEIRGVDADGAVRSLVARGLVTEVGRDASPGQPLLYGTTPAFLEQLGLSSLEELPPLPDLGSDGPLPAEPPADGYREARRALSSPPEEPHP